MPVLATKLFVPPQRPQAVSRSRVTRKLDEELRRGAKLTPISAPADFGRTTVLSEWIASSQLSSPDLRIAWLSLAEVLSVPICRQLPERVALCSKVIGQLRRLDQNLDKHWAEESQTGRVSAQNRVQVFKCGQNVGRSHNGPDCRPEEMLVRLALYRAPGGI